MASHISPHTTPTLGVASARDTFSARLRRLRMRVTPQRLLVMEALATGQGRMTADEIMRWAAERSPAINLATIYRTLDLLVSVGLSPRPISARARRSSSSSGLAPLSPRSLVRSFARLLRPRPSADPAARKLDTLPILVPIPHPKLSRRSSAARPHAD